MLYEVRHYLTASGRNPFEEWLDSLRDAKAEARIAARIARLAVGNFGDCKLLTDGVRELRIDWGPGYRVYCAMSGRTCVLLLCGADNRRQSADIDRAVEYWKDYQRRSRAS
jgi:putative addiction module killer protein